MGKEARKMEMGMVMGTEEMGMGKVTGEDGLRWLITMLLSFSQRGTQTRIRIILSRRELAGVQPRMCSLLLC
jgi:hypothetical protein